MMDHYYKLLYYNIIFTNNNIHIIIIIKTIIIHTINYKIKVIQYLEYVILKHQHLSVDPPVARSSWYDLC